MKLKDGYSMRWGDIPTGGTCGNGCKVAVELTYHGKPIHIFETCPCGRGCGGKDVVVDDWDYHDCEPEIEAVREDN